MNTKIKFSCTEQMTSTSTHQCTRSWMNEKLDLPYLAELVEQYRMGLSPNAKASLPAPIFQGYIPDGSRIQKNAQPSGLVLLDIDDHDGKLNLDPRKFYTENIEPRISSDLKHILMVYVTVSGHGLRIVAKCQQSLNIEREQRLLFDQIKGNVLPEATFDTSCKDLSRLSFLTSRNDLLYMNEDELFDGVVELPDEQPSDETPVAAQSASEKDAAASAPVSVPAVEVSTEHPLPIKAEIRDKISQDGLFFGETAYSDIVNELMHALHITGQRGTRNNKTFQLTCHLRQICRSEEHLMQIMPQWGLSREEMQATIHSACKDMRNDEPIGYLLKSILSRLSNQDETSKATPPAMPSRLPRGIKVALEPFPKHRRPALAIMLLPAFGTLATGARFQYRGSEVHSLSFISCLVSPQATGKSSMKKLCERILKNIIEQDNKNRETLKEYRDEREAAGLQGPGPKNPHISLRCLDPKTTYAAFVDLMGAAEGKHLHIIATEIHSIEETWWWRKGETVRLCFDNDNGGQDAKSNNAAQGHLPFYCNMDLSGTPNAVMQKFKDPENGSVGRVAFCTYERDNVDDDEDVDKARTDENEAELDTYIDKLMKETPSKDNEKNPYVLKRTLKAILDWCKSKKNLYEMTREESVDTFRKRSAVIGFRAGALAFLLEDKHETATTIKFGLWVAEYVFFYQMKFFGPNLNVAMESNKAILSAPTINPNQIIFSSIKDTFTPSDLSSAFIEQGKQGTGARVTISRWIDKGWIKAISRGIYSKTALGKRIAQQLSEQLSHPLSEAKPQDPAETSDQNTAV